MRVVGCITHCKLQPSVATKSFTRPHKSLLGRVTPKGDHSISSGGQLKSGVVCTKRGIFAIFHGNEFVVVVIVLML